LEQAGWLSEDRFVENLVHRYKERFGICRIINELEQHAIEDSLIEQVRLELKESEYTRAKQIWQKKYSARPTAPTERAKQARFLAMRGFAYETIYQLLGSIEEDGEASE
jgi:regulatory protein